MEVENHANPLAYYQENLKKSREKLAQMKKKLLYFAVLRLGIFIGTIVAVIFLLDYANVALITGIGGIALFLFTISKNTDLRLEKRAEEKKVDLNEREIRLFQRDFSEEETGEAFMKDAHFFNQDIDLFGMGSLFQMINRTGTLQGREKLASLLNSNDTEGVEEKQEAIQELKGKAKWRHGFYILAALIEKKVENTYLIEWIRNYEPCLPKKGVLVATIFSFCSLAFITICGLSILPISAFVLWVLFGLAITGIFFKKTSRIYTSATQMRETFEQYAKLLKTIEGQQFDAKLLVSYQEAIRNEEREASRILAELAGHLGSLDQRNNIFIAILGNGMLLWELRFARKVEGWIEKNRKTSEKWFEVIASFDAYNSLSNFAFNHPHYCTPKVTTEKGSNITAESLGHPLLKEDQRITNDFMIKDDHFFIITGANMAGKSTFLRTVALNLVMANCGMPVCASSFSFRPIRLISSMRTTDSLQDDTSYFFSELKRLKFIVEQIQDGEYFIILDEILKGTNSKDKEEGSKRFVQRLVSMGATGIIATHDLTLCELANDHPQIINRYFDAEIKNDELYFDYRFKEGVCQNMNASFLLKKMEIV